VACDIDIAVERLIDIPQQGTVVVGTIVAGDVMVGDVLEFRQQRGPVGAIEHGRVLLASASEGDRVGILLGGCHFVAP
jgi:translation elongation factor EF-Tu-like GTPase